MARSLNASLRFRANQLQGNAMLQLFEVQVQADPALYEYWTDYNASVRYFKPSSSERQIYEPFPIKAGELETDDGSKAPAMQIMVGAVSQDIVAYIETQDALRRNRIRRLLVPYDETGERTKIASGGATEDNMRISAVDGTAFVDFSDANFPTDYIGKYLKVIDSAGKKIEGFTKAAGTGETLGAEIDSGTLTERALYKVTAEGEADTFPTNKAGQNVALDGLGASGITVPDDADLDQGSNNCMPFFYGSIPDWQPDAEVVLVHKHDGSNGIILSILPTGVIRTTINADTYDSTIANTFAAGSTHFISAVITRETASVAGSVQTYADGVVLGAAVAITAGAPTTVDNAENLYFLGISATQYAGTMCAAGLYNRAPDAAAVLALYNGGDITVAAADQWGSQTAVYTSDFSAGVDNWNATNGSVDGNIDSIGGLDDWLRYTCNALSGGHRINHADFGFVAGKKHRMTVQYYLPSTNSVMDGIRFVAGDGTQPLTYILTTKDTVVNVTVEFTGIAGQMRVYGYSGGGLTFQDVGGDDVFYIRLMDIRQIGATLLLAPEGIRLNKWWDSSTNNLDAAYPAAGCTPDVDEYFTAAGTEVCDASNKVKQITAPAETGVTIVSVKDGTAYNWTNKESGFDYNDLSGFSGEIFEPGNPDVALIDTMYVDGAFIDHEKEIATFELTSKGAIYNITVPGEAIRRDQCSAEYKNASTCRYSGTELTCRKTKDACASKNNVINFKGFPGIGTKRIIFA